MTRLRDLYLGLLRCCAVAVAMMWPGYALPFPVGFYASRSVLASGNWVKVSVESSGIHFISASDLRGMGFADPMTVGVYGYGGLRLPEVLDQSTYIDDLPRVQSLVTSEGIYFYAVGPSVREEDRNGLAVMKSNPFSSRGYYFLSDSGALPEREIPSGGRPGAESPVSFFVECLHHEVDAVSPGETGHYMVGEEMRYTSSRTLRFALPGLLSGGTARAGASLCTDLRSGASWTMTAAGRSVTVPVAPTPSGDEYHGVSTEGWTDDFTAHDRTLEVSVTLNAVPGNTGNAWIDWVTVNYEREISVAHSPAILFYADRAEVALNGVQKNTIVWDVTDQHAISVMNTAVSGDVAAFTSDFAGERRMYAAFTPGKTAGLPSPVFVERVAGQNLHGLSDVDMVIFTSRDFLSAAGELARHRREFSGLNVAVVAQDDVFNEFASGNRDVGAFRKMLKMLYDRGMSSGRMLKYVLLMGRGSYDNRCVTKSVAALDYDPMPLWQTDNGLNDNTSYTSDDPVAMLADGSGYSRESDMLSVAVGRLPVTSDSEARAVVAKIIEYEKSVSEGAWRQRVVVIADDDDDCVHMRQAEEHSDAITSSGAGRDMVVEKIYLDAYQLSGGEAVGARDELFGNLDDGVVWVSYLGHASSTALSGEGILKYSDMGSLYLRRLPFIYAATCNFMRWDADAVSGAEMLAATRGGGVIGAISATRPVLVSQNGLLSSLIGEELGVCGADGEVCTVGRILQRAKNRMPGDANRLRFALLGDPAMRLPLAGYRAVVDAIDGVPVQGSDRPLLMAGQKVTVGGHIEDASGAVVTSFGGRILSTLYDADESVVTEGRGGTPFTFDRHGLRLFAGNDTVVGGRFEIPVVMPADVADNYREATLALFAENGDGFSAAGKFRDFYVYGSDDTAEADTIAPSIDRIYLNHASFSDGGTVNSTPVLIAEVSDNRAINLSLAGVGRSMMISIDNGAVVCDDVSDSYYPSSVSSGVIRYRLPELPDGPHTLTLRVWDTGGNSATATLEFFVDSSSGPHVYDIFASAVPSSSKVSFSLVHDRPDATLRVTVAVYDMLGRPVWINTSTGRSDLFTSSPVEWNLNDMGGRRVQRGIYIYRAWVSEYSGVSGSGPETATPARKMAISGI